MLGGIRFLAATLVLSALDLVVVGPSLLKPSRRCPAAAGLEPAPRDTNFIAEGNTMLRRTLQAAAVATVAVLVGVGASPLQARVDD